MNRLTVAALSAAILLAACTEKTPEAPTGPSTGSPSLTKAATGSCQTPFPLTTLLGKTGSMFGGAPVDHAADSRIETIASQCGKGKVGNARHEALNFVDWMIKKYGKDQLPDGTASKLADLISTLFVAVGFQDGEIDPGAFGPRGAAGIYDENSNEDFLLQNSNKSAAVLIRAHCLPTSLITMIPLPDSPQLVSTGGRRQFPPFYDINAANADGDHTIAEDCSDLLIGFCVDQAVLDQTDNPQIGHNPSAQEREELDKGPFEVLRAANSGEYGELDLEFCPGQANGFSEIGLSPPGGLEGLALSAWHKASGYIRPLANVLLPQRLHATTIGGLGVGSGGRGISTFGVVDDVVPGFTSDGDPSERTFYSDGESPTSISWGEYACEGPCYPRVRVLDFFDNGVGDVDVNVTLVPEGESTGELRDGEGGTPGPVTTDSYGYAVFDDLYVTADGTYRLEFTVRGNEEPLQSGAFDVCSDCGE